jgi:hypothetical protein
LAGLEKANPVPPAPKRISLTDPASTWTAAAGPAIFTYSTNYLIDLKEGLIVDVEASAVNKMAEVHASKIMIDRVEEKFAIKPRRLVGATNYGIAAMLEWRADEKRVAPHVPVWDKSKHYDGTFRHTDFFFDAESNRYVCPAGKYLRPPQRGQVKSPLRYRASVYDCRACDLKPKCCANMVAARSAAARENLHAISLVLSARPRPIASRAGSKESGNTVCPPQTHPQARPIAFAWTQRCP